MRKNTMNLKFPLIVNMDLANEFKKCFVKSCYLLCIQMSPIYFEKGKNIQLKKKKLFAFICYFMSKMNCFIFSDFLLEKLII